MAAGGPTVTLIFNGDADPLRRTMSTVGSAVKGLGALGAVGAGAGLAAAAGLALVPLALAGIGVAALSANEDVKKSFDEMGNSIKTTIGEAAQPLVGVFQGITKDVNAALGGMKPQLTELFAAAGPMITTLTHGVLDFVHNAMPGFQAAMTASGPIIDVMARGIAEMGTAFTGFMQGLATGAPGASAALDGIFQIINGLLPILGTLIGQLSNAFGPVLQALAPVIVDLAAQFAGMLSHITLLAPVISFLAPVIASLVPAILAGVAAFKLITGAVKAWQTAQLLLNLAMSMNPFGIVVIAIAALVAILIYAWQNSETFRNVVLAAWEAVKTGISAAVTTIIGIIGWFGQLPGIVGGFFGQMKDAAIAKGLELVAWVAGLPGMILGAIGNLGSLLVNAGRDLLTGLWNGISGAASWLRSQISNFFGSLIPGWAKQFLGIGSPSKVFADIGQWVPEGFAGGIEGNLAPVNRAGEDMASAAMGSAAGASVGGSAATGGAREVRFTGNVDSAFATAFMKLVRTGQIQIT